MGDLDSSTSTPKENGQLGYASASPWPPETENPHPSSIPNESWILAEETMVHMITKIQPTKQSEERRRNVVEYIQKIIKQKLGCEVTLLSTSISQITCFIAIQNYRCSVFNIQYPAFSNQ